MKRYQVFVSSTFDDLKEARSAVLKSILKLGCFPAGMEWFPSASMEQFEYIKKIIDDSDYYILIIGGRYGDDSHGLSYTEMEFDYAVSKEIPVLAFIHEHPEDIPAKYYELDEAKREKLNNFRKKVMQERMVSFWNTSDQLSSEVSSSLENAIKTTPRKGWERSLLESNEELLENNLKLKKENQQFANEIKRLKSELTFFNQDINQNINCIKIMINGSTVDSNDYKSIYHCDMTLKKIFSLWYPYLLEIVIDSQAKLLLEGVLCNHLNLENFVLDDDCYVVIKGHLSQLNMLAEFSIRRAIGSSKHLIVTDRGKYIWDKIIEI